MSRLVILITFHATLVSHFLKTGQVWSVSCLCICGLWFSIFSQDTLVDLSSQESRQVPCQAEVMWQCILCSRYWRVPKFMLLITFHLISSLIFIYISNTHPLCMYKRQTDFLHLLLEDPLVLWLDIDLTEIVFYGYGSWKAFHAMIKDALWNHQTFRVNFFLSKMAEG